MRKIELLAPAKDAEHGRMAVDFGADALYIGGARFGARHAAANSADDVARLVEYARGYGVRVYATLNTVLLEGELADAERNARELIAAGVDALIVQDMAFMRMGLEGVELHASTQMANATPEKVRFLSEVGFSRVILERGLSLAQIGSICRDATCDIECFVHGAICVGNSGECYMSRSLGSRSGNRGECSQPCRLSYDLVDAQGNVVTRGKHLLSLKDMNLTPRLGQLLDAGVTSFKIEGRLKDANYIKNVVGHYRQSLDRLFSSSGGRYGRSSQGRTELDFAPDPAKSFTRGGSLYFIDGKSTGVGSPNTPKSIGREVGVIDKVGHDWFTLRTNRDLDLAAGDGVCVVTGGQSDGTNINKVEQGRVYPNRMDAIVAGGRLYCNYDHRFSQAVERSRTRRVVDVRIVARLSAAGVTVRATDGSGLSAEVASEGTFEMASNRDKMLQTLRTQLGKSGDTIFAVSSVKVDAGNEIPFLPITVINDLRRRVLGELTAKRMAMRPEPSLREENMAARCATNHLGGEANVTNSLARRFYTDHGVEAFDDQLELADTLRDKVVMTTPFCIRREMGECLRNKPKLRGDLWLVRGSDRYELQFDCRQCIMKVIKR